MKKIFALLLAGVMIFTLASCDGEKVPIEENPESIEENIEEVSIPEEIEEKMEGSKTLTIFRELLSGSYTLETEIYEKFTEEKKVGSTVLTVVDGENTYMETTSYVGDASATMKMLIKDGYQYMIEDESRTVMKSAIDDKTNLETFMEDEEFYLDMVGNPTEEEVFGEKLYCEKFSGQGESIRYCYDGDDLKYIIAESGGVDFIMGVKELKSGADASYFEIPEDYTMYG